MLEQLDDRRLLVELQSLGVRVEEEDGDALPGRRGGAGPSDALFLWVRGLPLTVPAHASFVQASPYVLRRNGRKATLFRDDELIGPVTVPRRPKIYDMETADGIPYWKIALLHLDSIASTVVQKCIYWGTHEQCGFCGIELTRGEQTIPVKTPAQLAEVCTAARDHDHAVDVTLTTGSLNRRDRGAIYISRCAAAIKEASGLPIQVQFEPPDDLRVLDEVKRAGVDAVGIHSETFDPEVLARVAPGKAQCGIEGYFATWERAVEVFGRGAVTTYVLLGHGREAGADRRGLPARGRDGRLPVRGPAAAGARHADGRLAGAGPGLRRPHLRRGVGHDRRRRPEPPRRQGRLRPLPGLLGAVGLGARGGAGAGRCPRRRSLARLTCRLVETADELAAHHAVRHQVFVLDQRLFVGNDRDERDLAADTLHAVGVDHDALPGTAGDAARVVAAPCGSIRSTIAASGRATGWRCCPRRACATSARCSCASPWRPRASAAGTRWSPASSSRTCASSSSSAGTPTGPPGPYHGVTHQPMAIPLGPAP